MWLKKHQNKRKRIRMRLESVCTLKTQERKSVRMLGIYQTNMIDEDVWGRVVITHPWEEEIETGSKAERVHPPSSANSGLAPLLGDSLGAQSQVQLYGWPLPLALTAPSGERPCQLPGVRRWDSHWGRELPLVSSAEWKIRKSPAHRWQWKPWQSEPSPGAHMVSY